MLREHSCLETPRREQESLWPSSSQHGLFSRLKQRLLSAVSFSTIEGQGVGVHETGGRGCSDEYLRQGGRNLRLIADGTMGFIIIGKSLANTVDIIKPRGMR
jgi:hypothetical protein